MSLCAVDFLITFWRFLDEQKLALEDQLDSALESLQKTKQTDLIRRFIFDTDVPAEEVAMLEEAISELAKFFSQASDFSQLSELLTALTTRLFQKIPKSRAATTSQFLVHFPFLVPHAIP